LHCSAIYKPLLELLEKEYGLKNGNLIDVHSLCYKLSTLYAPKAKPHASMVPEPSVNQQNPNYDKNAALASIFLKDEDFNQCIELLQHKKNIILQGPPGVGKTFIAHHLACALMGEKSESRIKTIQFHQSYAYEDFIQGFRPDKNGTFYLKNGVFYDFCQEAKREPEKSYVFIIDEINRGNLSKIFGELMMLVESDKRGSRYALRLTYSSADDDAFFVPENVYLIGTMNTADRSLAMVDYALRRRFSFVDLAPCFRAPKFNAFLKENGVADEMLERINSRLEKLNELIAGEARTLGKGFCIGHSYFCPNSGPTPHDDTWFKRIVRFEIAPLLQEYWFDSTEIAEAEIEKLLA